jgi:hypothetical protein
MDETDAARIFGSANIRKLTKFKMDGGVVDFGDQIHAAGTPQGTAIIATLQDELSFDIAARRTYAYAAFLFAPLQKITSFAGCLMQPK